MDIHTLIVSKSRMGALDAAPAAGKPLLDEAELQKAWDTLAEQPDGVTVVVTEDFGYERGLLPESPRVTRNGTSGFLVTLDSMHQAHCVVSRSYLHHKHQKANKNYRMPHGAVFGLTMKMTRRTDRWHNTTFPTSGTRPT